MNNVTVLENGQQISVNLIAYFNNNNNKYVFYTKNETVQDGLIKMYVAKEKNGSNETITDDEWTTLKKNMQNIIMGNSDVTFIQYSDVIDLNPAKAIALKDYNISAITSAYNNAVNNVSAGTNKDFLNESFGAPQIESLESVNNIPNEPVVETPIISDIPQVQNNFNMESTPINLNMDSSTPVDLNAVSPSTDSINNIEPIPSAEPEMPVINNNEKNNQNNEVLSINSIKPVEAINDNEFKVSNEPNIFDQVKEEIVNNNIENTNSSVESTIDNSKQIELNERKIKVLEELVEIYKEENNLLSNKEDLLEKTASNLFNNNGTLNESSVLDQE